MAKSNQVRFEYVGDGATRTFAVPFTYINPEDVEVYVNGSLKTGTLSPGFVQVQSAPAVGAAVVVQRSTEARIPLHSFQHGSPLLPGLMDDNFRQTLYAVEEATGVSERALSTADTAQQTSEQAILDSAQAVLDSAAAVQTANQADTKADSALSTAGSASSAAAAAVSTAGNALSTANSATGTANQAAQDAQQALTDAGAAVDTANAALQAANQAEQKADSAIGTAGTASYNATVALSTANTAIGQADSAVQTANQAELVADSAQQAAAGAVSTAGAAEAAALTAVGTANAIDGKAQTALDNSVDAVQRVGVVEGTIANLEAGGVTSFNGRVGSIVPEAGDYAVQDISGLSTALSAKADTSSLKAVATTGDFNDLTNKPAAPQSMTQVQAEDSGSTAFRLVSGQRIWQAISKWWDGIGTAFGKTLLGSADAAAARGSLGLGTAATVNIVASNTDHTEGRVLRVGSGGWMGQISRSPEALGYPQSWAENITSVIGANATDNGVNIHSAGIHFATADTWGRLRVSYNQPRAWVQGGLSTNGTGWTAELTHSGNLQSNTGSSTQYPMSQKATTDAINARGFVDASGVLTAQSGALSNTISSFLQATTQADARSRLALGTAATANSTISTAGPSGGVNGDIWFQIE